MSVELNVCKKSCRNLVKESCNILTKKIELDNHVILSLEGLQLAGPSARALSPASWRPSRRKKSWLSSSEFFYPDIT